MHHNAHSRSRPGSPRRRDRGGTLASCATEGTLSSVQVQDRTRWPSTPALVRRARYRNRRVRNRSSHEGVLRSNRRVIQRRNHIPRRARSIPRQRSFTALSHPCPHHPIQLHGVSGQLAPYAGHSLGLWIHASHQPMNVQRQPDLQRRIRVFQRQLTQLLAFAEAV